MYVTISSQNACSQTRAHIKFVAVGEKVYCGLCMFFLSHAVSVETCSSKIRTQVAALCWKLKDVTWFMS
jgi:hypothetical protein